MKSYFFLFLLLATSCNANQNKNLVGTYESVTELRVIDYFTPISFSTGCKIILTQDSLFTYQTCGNIMKGKWSVVKDSLYLNCATNRYRNDSLNGVCPNMRVGIVKYKIEGIYFKQYTWSSSSHGGKRYRIINLLKKKEV